MANRYWVGGTASWNGTAGSKWATTSGGAGGQAVPTSSDDVFFDAASGAVTVTVDTVDAACLSLNFTGFTGTFAGSSNFVGIYGNLVLGSGMTWTHSNQLKFFNASGTKTITSNGVTISSSLSFDCTGATIQLADDLITTGSAGQSNGTFDANNKNFTCHDWGSSNSNVRSILMGSGTWTITGANVAADWEMTTTTNLTFNAGTSTIRMVGGGAESLFGGGGKTYYNLWFDIVPSASNHGALVGNNTFNDLKLSAGVYVDVTPGSTTTLVSLTSLGTAGNEVNILAGSAATFSKASGVLSTDYMYLVNIVASGSVPFYAGSHSIDGTGNTNWIFGDAPNTSQYPKFLLNFV